MSDTPSEKSLYLEIKHIILFIYQTSKYGSNYFWLGGIALFAKYLVLSTPGDGEAAVIRVAATVTFSATLFLLLGLAVYDFIEKRRTSLGPPQSPPAFRSPPTLVPAPDPNESGASANQTASKPKRKRASA